MSSAQKKSATRRAASSIVRASRGMARIVSPNRVRSSPEKLSRLAIAGSYDERVSVDVLHWEGFLQGEELAHLATEPERDGRFASLPDDLHPGARDAVAVPQLYAPQRAAWDAAQRGENVLVPTGTASGKTLAFNLPVLDAIA